MDEKAASQGAWSAVSQKSSKGAPGAELFVATKRDTFTDNAIQRPSVSYWKDAWIRICKNKIALASGAYIILLAIAAMVVPTIIHYSHDDQEVWNLHLPPNLGQQAIVVDTSSPLSAYQPIFADETTGSEDEEEEMTFDPPEESAVPVLYGDPLTSGIAIKWEPVPGAEHYRIYRSIDATTLGIPLHDAPSNELSYLDTNTLSANATYYYRVLTSNAFGESEPGEPLTIKPLLALTLDQARAFAKTAEAGDTVTTPAHYFGTDYLGRDMLARVMVGARISLFIGFGAPILYILIGIIYGSISGYIGGLTDDLMMRFADMVSTVPELLTVIMLQVFLGSGVITLIIALVLVAWARSARQIRGETLKLREAEFVQAAKVLGTSTPAIIGRHILPNVTGTVLVLFTLAIPQAIFTEAFLSFIGLGIAPPLASWGSVTREGAKVFLTYPHELVVPAVFICITMFAFNMLGDGLRDALDPKLRGAR